jgi:hypothetical protein
MRETLYQLTLTLALPIAVGAVWVARAEWAEPPARERATAYRVELDDLPLPIRERLRTPGFELEAPAARPTPEEGAPTRERPIFETRSQPEPEPLDLAARAGSRGAQFAAPSPRAVQQPLDAPAATPRAAPRIGSPIAITAPSLSHRGTAARLAPSTTGAPSADLPVVDADRVLSKQDRILERKRLLSPSDDFRFRGPGRPIALVDPHGRKPLVPSDPIDRPKDFSRPISELPRLEPPQSAKPEPSVDFGPEIEEPTPVQRSSLRPTFRFVPVPEPGSAILFGAALGALGALRRR